MDVLIVDDDAVIRRAGMQLIEDCGHYAKAASNATQALEQLKEGRFELVLLDLNLGESSGMDLLPELVVKHPGVAVVVVTSMGSISLAVEAMRRGAADFIEKPFTRDHFAVVLQRVLNQQRLSKKVEHLQREITETSPDCDFESASPAVCKAMDVVFRAADTDASILILGESGTGKTVVARAIHARSSRKDQAFLTVNCPALTRELLESELFGHVRGAFTGAVRDSWGKVRAADRGSLFLDEVGELPKEVQPKLLRLLQDREYERVGETAVRKADVRVLAATNRDLRKACVEGDFREDLLFRLNVVSIVLPPLRERREDLPRFAENYLRFFSRQYRRNVSGFSPEAARILLGHPWPGNLRELRNAVERAVILATGSTVCHGDLPPDVTEKSNADPSGGDTLEEMEAAHIRKIIDQTGNLAQAAGALGIDAATLYRKRKRLGLIGSTDPQQ